MSMIGLFTATPQVSGTKATTGTPATAAGFSSTLQGALDALAKGTAEESTPLTELAAATSSLAEGAVPGSAGTPLVEPVETPSSLVELVETPMGNSTAATPTTPLVELVETPTGSPAAASLPTARTADLGGSSATGSAGPNSASGTAAPLVETAATPTTPLVELVETAASKGSATGTAASTASATGAAPASTSAATVAPASLVELVETPTGNPTAASTSAATGRAASTVSATGAAPASTSAATVAPASTNSASGVAAAAAPTPQTPTRPSADPVPVQAPTAVAAPANTPVQSTAPSVPTAPPTPTQQVPFTAQLAKPIFSLAAAGPGSHVMTVSVTPDNLGPVTVRAHVGAEGVRVELFAPNDLGRDAIRAIIPELRRDLAGAGLGGNLSLSSQNQPSSDGAAEGSHAGQPGERDSQRGGSAHASAANADSSLAASEPEVDRTGRFGTTSTIDVLA